jgi:hypothetical protein
MINSIAISKIINPAILQSNKNTTTDIIASHIPMKLKEKLEVSITIFMP